jgi:hypothetical protein
MEREPAKDVSSLGSTKLKGTVFLVHKNYTLQTHRGSIGKAFTDLWSCGWNMTFCPNLENCKNRSIIMAWVLSILLNFCFYVTSLCIENNGAMKFPSSTGWCMWISLFIPKWIFLFHCKMVVVFWECNLVCYWWEMWVISYLVSSAIWVQYIDSFTSGGAHSSPRFFLN